MSQDTTWEEENDELENSDPLNEEDFSDLLDDNTEDESTEEIEEQEEEEQPLEQTTVHIVPSIQAASRKDPVTFSITGFDLTGATVEWTVYDKWLGPDDLEYVPEIKSNNIIEDGPDLANYYTRKLVQTGPSFTSELYYPGDIIVKAKIVKAASVDILSFVYRPKINRKSTISPTKMRIKYKAIQCAPLLSTHKIAAFYKGHHDFIASQLIIEEENNNISKIVNSDDDTIITKHTWKTAGTKYLTFKIFYDDGFRLRSSVFKLDFVIGSHEIRDKDDPTIIRDVKIHHQHHFDPYNPQKVYVICTKRCFTEIGCSEPVAGMYEIPIID